jgi:peroxiredoxin
MIKELDSLPDAVFKTLSDGSIQTLGSREIFDQSTTLIIGVIGPFSPICTARHLPEFIPYVAQLFEAKLVDNVTCIAAADPFSMSAWAAQLGCPSNLKMLTDTGASFAEKLGLRVDLSELGMGLRSTRYAMLVKDNKVAMLKRESKFNVLEETSKESVEVALNRFWS